MRGEQGRRGERLVVTTLKAVRNDGKQPDIKGRDTSKLLKSSPRISKISRPQSFIVGQTAQHICYRNPIVPAPKAKTTCRREREPHREHGDSGRVSVSQLLLEFTWGACRNTKLGPHSWKFESKTPQSSVQDSAFARGPSHCDNDSEPHFQKQC